MKQSYVGRVELETQYTLRNTDDTAALQSILSSVLAVKDFSFSPPKISRMASLHHAQVWQRF